ncbi:LysE family translocator [Nocardioides yefusunii]|uniref:LysE family translocator n=1 Tax=Nocardioides yefusunii TaxID=2500546 RepID=A0ABW1R354_9ACTN|nr:LysE family translocator [Nocardioides yefusunii]
MNPGTVAAFWGVSVMFAMTPGADWAYAISAGLKHRRVTPAVLGMLSGHFLVTLLVALGLAAVMAATPGLLEGLTLIGVVYLVWLGISMLRTQEAAVAEGKADESGSWKREALTGFGVSGLNPKVLLLLMALLPQFTDTASDWPMWLQVIALGCLHIAGSFVIYTAVGVSARIVLRTRPVVAMWVTRFSGCILLVVASYLLWEQLLH